jgi:hypothetical protein
MIADSLRSERDHVLARRVTGREIENHVNGVADDRGTHLKQAAKA